MGGYGVARHAPLGYVTLDQLRPLRALSRLFRWFLGLEAIIFLDR